MEDTEDIISKMIAQHRTLQKDLGDAASLEAAGDPDFLAIDKALKQFKNDLVVHLELENNIFYPELLSRMEKAGQDTARTKEFINEMSEIGQIVMSFLAKYKDDKVIANKIVEFEPELILVTKALNLRIESEESGIYSYWGMF